MNEIDKKNAEKKALQKIYSVVAKIYLPLAAKAIHKKHAKK